VARTLLFLVVQVKKKSDSEGAGFTTFSDTLLIQFLRLLSEQHKGGEFYMFAFRTFCALAVVVLLLLAAVSTPAQKKSRTKDAARHSGDAAETFTEIMNVKDKAIPKELLDTAEAIAVFPGVLKAAFVFGGRGGQGVISRRVKGGWSAPAFFNLGGGSFGAQIGAQKTDYILLIMNESGLNGLLRDKFELGGEVGISAGPVGREAAASTNPRLDAGILSYSRSNGAFIGAALKGAVISPDNDLNEAIYGQKAEELLKSPAQPIGQMPTAVRIFPRTLVRYSIR
jgi:lipid-binding SYLF domain-containing protein